MTALFVVFTIVFFLVLDTIQRKIKARKNVEQTIYFSEVGLTMADGGKEIRRVEAFQLELF